MNDWEERPRLDELAGKNVHLLGIGGIGVSACARLLLPHGVRVTGCDVRESTITQALREEGVEVYIGHSPAHVDEADVVVYSTAVPDSNPEMAYARTLGKPLLHRSHLLSILTQAHTTIGVTGTNGKGTVCAMLTWILECAGQRPAFYIGGLCPNLGINARDGGGPRMVAELDESDGSLLNIRPAHALVNNLDLDHLNYYKNFDQVVDTLTAFCSQLADDALLFFNGDDPGAMQVAEKLEGRNRVLFGSSPECDYRFTPIAVGDSRSCFSVTERTESGTEELGDFDLSVPGHYNIENAIGAIAVARCLGVPVPAIREALTSFRGLDNRYTMLCAGDRRIIKDYMSHPMGMRKVLQTARLGEPERLVAVFKPYRYTMIRYHAANYAGALASADEVIITTMWAGGEEPIPGVDTSWLVEQLRDNGLNVTYIREMEEIVDYLVATSGMRDCAVFFGGDDLFQIAECLHARFAGPGDE